MKRKAAIIIVVLATFLWTFDADARRTSKRVLLLNSYHQNLAWVENINRGVIDVLRPTETGMELLVENMDTKRVEYSEEYKKQLHEVYAHKYAKMRPDLVLASDNNAFEFLKEYHEELFKDVPVVFCGVNDFREEMLRDQPLFTGVSEEVDALETVRVLLKLQPSTTRIFVINDDTPTGRAWESDMRKQLGRLGNHIKLTYARPMSFDSLLTLVSSLEPDTVVLLGAYFRDSLKRYIGGKEAVRQISEASRVPVFGLLDFALGNGIVGGMLTSGYRQGQAMAQLGLLVLSGRHPEDLPVITTGLVSPQYDYTQLRRFGMDPSDLPPDSDIINMPRSFYEQHYLALYGIGIFLAVQTLVILFLAVNITRRKQAENSLRRIREDLELRVRERTSELKESEEALRVVFDSTHDGIIVHTPEGFILDANQGMLDMFGIKRRDLPTLSITRDICSRSCPLHQLSAMWREVAAGADHTFEWVARRPIDGTEFDVEIHLSPILFRKRAAILANVRNISERKHSENRLRQTLSKLEAILDNSLMGIAMTRGEIVETINQRGAETFGYTPEEVEGANWAELIEPSDGHEILVRETTKSLSVTGEYLTERLLTGKGNHASWCRMYAKAVDMRDLSKGVIWAWDDITDIKTAEDELRATREQALNANRAKTEFLAAMSHEIRTPMNAIVGMTEITLQTELAEDQRDYLLTVKESADHLLQIINDILDLSKIEAKKLELDNVDFDLPRHMTTTIKALEVQAAQKGLDLTLDINENVPVCVKGDPVCLRQVIVNLVGNAIKFTHNGHVAVRVFPGETQLDDEGCKRHELRFEVEDSGIGIPPEFMDSIFQSFSQNTRAYGGTGLGLSICREIIKLMGGSISVESEAGRGSTFRFTVYMQPGLTCPGIKTTAPLPAASDGKALHILLAEDNPVNVMVTALRLEEMGHTHDVAQNGEEVLEMLRSTSYDMILMDVEMPVMDGLSATRSIRAATPEMGILDPEIPIIAMTAHALKEFRDKCLEAGMNAYVSKPVDFEELMGIMNRLRKDTATVLVTSHEEQEAPEPMPEPPVPDPVPADEPEPRRPGIPDSLGLDPTMLTDLVRTGIAEAHRLAERVRDELSRELRMEAKKTLRTIGNICRVIGAHNCSAFADQTEAACRIAPEDEILARLSSLLGMLDELAEENNA
ncbi:ATP-binding protein [Salidesulfovibrio brasiliensis]